MALRKVTELEIALEEMDEFIQTMRIRRNQLADRIASLHPQPKKKEKLGPTYKPLCMRK